MGVVAAIRSPGAIALIGAIAGVVGGVLGALAGGWATYRIEAQRQRFERRRFLRSELRDRERELAAVRGAARVWRTKFDDFRHLVSDYPRNPERETPWWADPYAVDTSMSVEDMKAVAAALTFDQWYTIDVALSGIRAVEGVRTWWWGLPIEDRSNLEDDEKAIVDSAVGAIDGALEVLDGLSERLPELPDEPSV